MLSYREALQIIFERTDFERGERPPYVERVYRLSRVHELLAAMGDPHRAYRTVHVAGTKGKGSVTAMVDAVLRAAGYRTGMYTSPHLHTFRERIQLNGAPVSEDDIARGMGWLAPILATRREVTVFEIITALAMGLYAEAGVDWGVFEVGLGGRLDATNVLAPEVAVITSISLDHINVLGDTLEAIAGEKAGIIKPQTPVVTAPQRPGALGVIVETAARHEAPLSVVGRDWQWRRVATEGDLGHQVFDVYAPGHEDAPEYPALSLPLLGAHQLENACTAVAAIEVLRERGIEVPREAVRQGLAAVRWPGRMEVLGREPLVVVDGAHNPYSVGRLLDTLGEYLDFERVHLVFGAGATHRPAALLEVLLPAVHSAHMVRAPHPKATPPDELVAMARALGYAAQAHDPLQDGLEAAIAEAGARDLVLVTGSLFVVAAAREAWARMRGLPAPGGDPAGIY